eukprot:Ihof_evm6s275 gene=Ihof_evmTU6s275
MTLWRIVKKYYRNVALKGKLMWKTGEPNVIMSQSDQVTQFKELIPGIAQSSGQLMRGQFYIAQFPDEKLPVEFHLSSIIGNLKFLNAHSQ